MPDRGSGWYLIRVLLLTLFGLFLAITEDIQGQTFETLFADAKGSNPGDLVAGGDGAFYGITYQGGTANFGTVFKVTNAGELATVAVFTAGHGARPSGALVAGSDGAFYGTASGGGAHGYGTVFKVTPEGELTALASFTQSNGGYSYPELARGSDGAFYGTTNRGGSANLGTVFKVTTTGELTTLASFTSNTGAHPLAGLVAGSDGAFYGTTSRGGANDLGTVFKVTLAGELTALASFDGDNGQNPDAELLEGSDGAFYGTTAQGGSSGYGTVFKVTPAGELTTLISFTGLNGGYPYARLVQGSGGAFYGTTSRGGLNDLGTVFKMTPAGELTTLAAFTGSNGARPIAKLVQGSDGDFYGTTNQDGADGAGAGTVFKVTPEGQLTTLASFSKPHGSSPDGRLLKGNDGAFYGTASKGGELGLGTVFKVTSAGQVSTLVTFNGTNGANPAGGLMQGSDGAFYGITSNGGVPAAGKPRSYGTVFKVTPEGELTTLASFDGANGITPKAGLVQGNDGAFYGITDGGDGAGTVYKVTPAGVLTTLVNFNNFLSDTHGRKPNALVKGDDGVFYGVTSGGGAHGAGTIFKVTSTGDYTRLFTFDGPNGLSPRALVKGSSGAFFGITEEGGSSNHGTVFMLTNIGHVLTLVSFDGANGRKPRSLVRGGDSTFYGTTEQGGVSDAGTVFKVTSVGGMTTLGSFSGADGRYPDAGLVVGSDGAYYGVTRGGGANGAGTIFKVTPAGVMTTLHSFDGSTAAYPRSTPLFDSDGDLYGTAEQMAIWRLVLSSAPSVTTNAANAGTLSATLNSTVNPNGASTIVWFEYGTSTAYGSTTSLWKVPAGASSGPVRHVLQLQPHTTYHFRVVAQNAKGTTYGDDKSFTTLNRAPIAIEKTVHPGVAGSTQVIFSALADASDPDKDPLTVGLVSYSGAGLIHITPEGIVNFTGGLLKGAEIVTLKVSDGFGGGDEVLITLSNAAPVAAPDIVGGGYREGIAIPVLANDSDADGDALSVVSFTQAAHGQVVRAENNQNVLVYVPGQGFSGVDTFTYTVSDGRSAPVTGTVEITVGARPNLTTELTQGTGAPVPGAGQEGSGVPAGAAWRSFGVPAINDAGQVAFVGTWRSPEGSASAIFVDERLVVRTGDFVPGLGTATFKSLTEPVINGAGGVAFLATISGPGVKKNSDTVLVSDAFSGNLEVIAREGDEAPEADGAKLRSFYSISLQGDSQAEAGLLFSASLVSGSGRPKVTPVNDFGAWLRTPAQGNTLRKVVREGDPGFASGETIKSFRLLQALGGSPAQGRGHYAADGVRFTVTLSNKHQAVVHFSSAGALIPEAFTGDPVGVALPGTQWKSFGMPASERSGAVSAVRAVLQNGSGRGKDANTPGIFLSPGEGEAYTSVVMVGDLAFGVDEAVFSGLKDPLVSGWNSGVAFLGTIKGAKGSGIHSGNDTGIWWQTPQGWSLVAREGKPAAETPEGTRWKSFTSLALPDGKTGPLFLATLQPKAGLVSGNNDEGIWAVASYGEMRLLVRENEPVGNKTLKSFTALQAVSGSAGVSRSFNNAGQLVYRAYFSDGAQGVVRVQVP